MTKINCILFDLDGTLINTYDLVTKSFQHTIRKHFGKEISPEEILPYFGEPLWVTMERFSPELAPELLKTYREFNLAYHDELTTVFPGALQVLESIKTRGLPTGVVTSKVRHTAFKGLQLFNLDEYIDVCIALEDTPHHKPHPEPVFRALEALRARPEGTLLVGDSPFDLQCARNAGIHSAAVAWSFLPKDKLQAEKPDLFLQSFEDILNYL